MNAERIKEIQGQTAYPNSVSVQQALLKVWNECERQQPTEANNHPDTKQLIIGDVSKQRELLIAYTEYLAQQDITTSTYWLEVYNVDAFLKSNL